MQILSFITMPAYGAVQRISGQKKKSDANFYSYLYNIIKMSARKSFGLGCIVHFASFAPPEKRDSTSVLNDAGTLGCFKDALRMRADSISVCEMSLKR